MKIKLRLALATAVAILPDVVLAVGEDLGRIQGTITEAQSKAPIPGAKIRATGPSLIGPPRESLSGEDGSYELSNLPHGDYDIELSFSGVAPLHRRVEVRAGETTPLDIPWSVELTQVETTVVELERHGTRPEETHTGATFSIDKQNNLQVARQYQSIVSQAAGVIGTGNSYVKGGASRHNRILIDGLDTTDPVTNTFSANLNQETISSVQVMTGAMQAKYNALGSVQNIITKSGSDEFHLDVVYFVRPKQLQSFHTGGPQFYDYEQPYNRVQQPPNQVHQVGISASGPILRHQLWYSASFEFDYSSRVTPLGPPLNRQAPNRVFQDIYPQLKLTWAPAAKHRLIFQGLGDPTTIDYENNSGTTANVETPLASAGRFQGGWKGISEWDYFITNNLDTKVLLGYSFNSLETGPQGAVRSIDPKYGTYDFDRPRHVNNVDDSRWFNGTSRNGTYRHRWQLDASVTLRGHWLKLAHEAEVGVQSSFLYNKSTTRFTGGGLRYSDNQPGSGAALDQGLCDDDPFVEPDPSRRTGRGCNLRVRSVDYVNRLRGYTLGIYAQDRIKPVRWLTLFPGLRWDISQGWVIGGEGTMRLHGFGPRFGAIADVTGDQKTILQASYGRSTEMVYLSPLSTVSSQAQNISFQERYSNGAWVNPVQIGGPGSAFVDPRPGTPPHSDEFTVSFRRELFANSVGIIDYTYKRVSNVIDAVEQNVIYDPSGNRVIGYVNPAQRSSVIVLTSSPRNYSEYSGIDFQFESRFNKHLDFTGSYTLAWTYGPAYDEILGVSTTSGGTQYWNQFSNPRQAQMFRGYAPAIDRRHSIKTQTTYVNGPWVLGVVVNYRSGIAERKTYSNTNSGANTSRWRAPNGLDPVTPNDIESWSEFRIPPTFLVNVKGGYDFYSLTKLHLRLEAGIENLFDSFVPTGVRNTANSVFGQVSNREQPFQVQLGLRYHY